MASGFASIHPRMTAALQSLGVKDWQVTQGWGYAKASANYHAPEGRTAAGADGHPFSSCVDLPFKLASASFLSRMRAAGFAAFARESGNGWNGDDHIHAVFVGAQDWRGRVTILPGPRMQIIDFCRGRNGLVGHGEIRPYPPSLEERETIRRLYEAWAPSVPTRVLAPEGGAILCYAFLERDAVRCEARPFLEFFGATVGWDDHACRPTALYKGAPLDLSKARPKLAGEFLRADVRGLAEALGLEVSFRWLDATSAEVRLSR